MSAFIVNEYHLNALVSWASYGHSSRKVSYYWQGKHRPIAGDEQRVVNVLYAENVRSVNARYRENETADPIKFNLLIGGANLNPIEVCKAVHCLVYQSCETSDWEQSEAFAILQAIEAKAIRSVHGYENAAWELVPRTKVAA